MKAAAKSIDVASKDGRGPVQTAIQYVLAHPAVTSAVIGIRRFDQLEEAVKATSAAGLRADEIAALRKSVKAIIYKEHR